MREPTLAHLVGGGPMDGETVTVDRTTREIQVPFAHRPTGTFGMLRYVRESIDPDGLLGTYRFAGWPFAGWSGDLPEPTPPRRVE